MGPAGDFPFSLTHPHSGLGDAFLHVTTQQGGSADVNPPHHRALPNHHTVSEVKAQYSDPASGLYHSSRARLGQGDVLFCLLTDTTT